MLSSGNGLNVEQTGLVDRSDVGYEKRRGIQDDARFGSCTRERMELPFNGIGKTMEGAWFCLETEFDFELVKFEVLMRHPRGEVA